MMIDAPARPALALSRKLLLTVHLVTSVGVIGADLVLLVLGVAGRGSFDARAIYPAMSLVATWVIAPLAVVAIGSGLLLAVVTRTNPLRTAWVAVKLAITVVLTAVVLFALRPGLASAAGAANQSAAVPDDQRLLYAVAPAVSLGLLVLNAALGVYRPRRSR